MLLGLVPIACMIGWFSAEVRRARERAAFLSDIRPYPHVLQVEEKVDFEGKLSSIRRYFNDYDVYALVLPPDATDRDLAYARRLFPEAESIMTHRDWEASP
jgi:hypothetical protein